MQKVSEEKWSMGRAGQGRVGRGGFTLIEILVVILIIVVLMALLVPALGGARKSAYVANTKSLLSSLSSNCEAYFTIFHAYPGPVPSGIVAPNIGGTATAQPKISGAQNLLLGLSCALLDPRPAAAGGSNVGRLPSPAPPTLTQVTPLKWGGAGNPTAMVDAGKASGPINWASIRPDGSPEQIPPFFTPTAKQVSLPTAGGLPPVGGLQGIDSTKGNQFAFPVIYDAFPDSLPVLYYRRAPGASAPATAYNLAENAEYTHSGKANNGGLMAASGSQFPQDLPNYPADLYYSSDLTFAMPGQATATGGYLLIAAGPLRVYGNTGTVVAPKTDNIIVFGGN